MIREPYVRWCERKGANAPDLLDYAQKPIAKMIFHFCEILFATFAQGHWEFALIVLTHWPWSNTNSIHGNTNHERVIQRRKTKHLPNME